MFKNKEFKFILIILIFYFSFSKFFTFPVTVDFEKIGQNLIALADSCNEHPDDPNCGEDEGGGNNNQGDNGDNSGSGDNGSGGGNGENGGGGGEENEDVSNIDTNNCDYLYNQCTGCGRSQAVFRCGDKYPTGGGKKVYSDSFKTATTVAAKAPPYEIYGRVLKADQKTPVSGAIVYLKIERKSFKSTIASTLTDKNGQWRMDISALRKANLKNIYKLKNGSKERFLVQVGNQKPIKAKTKFRQDQPVPTIILDSNKKAEINLETALD